MVRLSPARRTRGRAVSTWVCVALVGAHFALRIPLDSWLNAPSDAKFVAAVVILIVPLLFAAFALYRAVIPKSHH